MPMMGTYSSGRLGSPTFSATAKPLKYRGYFRHLNRSVYHLVFSSGVAFSSQCTNCLGKLVKSTDARYFSKMIGSTSNMAAPTSFKLYLFSCGPFIVMVRVRLKALVLTYDTKGPVADRGSAMVSPPPPPIAPVRVFAFVTVTVRRPSVAVQSTVMFAVIVVAFWTEYELIVMP